MHDEAAIFQEEVAGLRTTAATPSKSDIDWTGFVVAYKGAFLEVRAGEQRTLVATSLRELLPADALAMPSGKNWA